MRQVVPRLSFAGAALQLRLGPPRFLPIDRSIDRDLASIDTSPEEFGASGPCVAKPACGIRSTPPYSPPPKDGSPMRTTSRRNRFSHFTLLLLLAIPILTAGCQTVEYYEKQRLIDPAMVFETDPTEVHFQQKVFYSMEGSAGGIGESAGGGCGCY